MEHVIAFDPGERTGWASAKMDEDQLLLTGTGVYDQDTMAVKFAEWQGIARPRIMVNPAPALEEYEPVITVPTFQKVVFEAWRPRRKNGSMDWIEGDALLSAQHVGQIRFIAKYSGARLATPQEPAQKETFRASLPEQFKELDRLSSELHDQDARLHLWGYFFENWFSASVSPEETVVLPL